MPPHQLLFWMPGAFRGNRALPFTLANLRDGCGFSGSDTAMLELAGEMAARGHGARVMVGGPASAPCEADPVAYLDPADRSPAADADLARVDTLVLSYWPYVHRGPDLAELRALLPRLPAVRSALLWCQSQYGDDELAVTASALLCGLSPDASIALVPVSRWADAAFAHVPTLPRVVIPNALSPAVFGPPSVDDPPREPLSFAFFASFDRGGRFVAHVRDRLAAHQAAVGGPPVGELRLAGYNTDQGQRSLSKRAVADMLRRSDYFVYPLVNDSGHVHHDTYGCVVLEAMACGCLVVTWDVACMRELYGAHAVLLPPPPHPGHDPAAPRGRNWNPHLLTPAAVDTLAAAVATLAALPEAEREGRRAAARDWALTQTWGERATALEALLEA